MKRNNTESQ